MEKLDTLLKEAGVSKVKLAKFLGVSRQMVYNYLALDDLSKWPKDKRVLMFNLFGITEANEVGDIIVNTEFIVDVENRLNKGFSGVAKKGIDQNDLYNGLDSKEKEILTEIVTEVRDLLVNKKSEGYDISVYLNHLLKANKQVEEIKYILGYVSKANGMTNPTKFVFSRDNQMVFEGIMFSAMNLYNNGGASKSKIAESHRRFVSQMDDKKEETLSRTMELNSARIQALKELGYTEINEKNAAEIFHKIAEIQARGEV